MRASEFIAEGRSLIPYTQQQIDDVKAAYDQGYTTEDTAKLLDIGYMDVKRILDRHYTERTSKPRPKRIQHNQPEIDPELSNVIMWLLRTLRHICACHQRYCRTEVGMIDR